MGRTRATCGCGTTCSGSPIAGLLTGPSLSWPIVVVAGGARARPLDPRVLEPGDAATVERLRIALDREMRTGDFRSQASAVGRAPTRRSCAPSSRPPREEGEATLSADWLGQRFAWKLSATVVADPDDDQTWRPDGSYFAMSLGNWMVSAGYLDRWWGPGLAGQPDPVQQRAADAVDRARPQRIHAVRRAGAALARALALLTFMGQFESDRDYPDALLFGMRVEIRPLPSLQIAASRTAQWCGDGRPCDLDTFWDLLIGNDNDQDLAEQPGNQLAGFDVRWSWPGARVPLALYAQAIGEDEAGFLPSKYLGLFGAEVWGDLGGGTWRAHVEYADTACDFLASPPEFGCAYTNGIYTDGLPVSRAGRSATRWMPTANRSALAVCLSIRAGHDGGCCCATSS